MMLRSSSTPVLGSLLSSYEESPTRDYESTIDTTSSKHLSFSHAGVFIGSQPNFSFSCNSSPNITSSLEPTHSSTRSSGFRRAQSEGNLQGLIPNSSDLEDFPTSKTPVKSSRKLSSSILETIPSFSIYNSRNEYEEEDEEGEEEEEKDESLKRSVTTDDKIMSMERGGFSFGKNMKFMEEMDTDNELQGLEIEEENQFGDPMNSSMFLARGLGIHAGGGGGDFEGREFGRGAVDESGIEEHYRKMVEENPCSSLVLRNYAQFLHQSKGDLQGAEKYYSRAILADPSDGEVLSQYAKLVWQLHCDIGRASCYFERAVQVSPGDSHVHAAYASFLWETEDQEENNLQKKNLRCQFSTMASWLLQLPKQLQKENCNNCDLCSVYTAL